MVVQTLKNKRTHAGTGTSGNRMAEHEAFQRVAAVGLSVNHFHDVVFMLATLSKTGSPVVSCTTSFFGDKKVLLVEQVPVGACLDAVDNSGLKINHKISWDEVIVISLVEEYVFSVVSIAGIVMQNTI